MATQRKRSERLSRHSRNYNFFCGIVGQDGVMRVHNNRMRALFEVIFKHPINENKD